MIPLTIYLLTFILAFARTSVRWANLASAALPLFVAPLALVLSAGLIQIFWIPLHLLAFFVGALVCHGQLAESRPAPVRLTGFYLAMALGGVLGGAFNVLLAPLVFDRLVEYPMAVVLASLMAPGVGARSYPPSIKHQAGDLLLPGIVFALTAILVSGGRNRIDSALGMIGLMITAGLGVYACVTGLRRPLRFALTVASVLLASALSESPGGRVVHRARDFFGILRVLHDPRTNTNRLMHGDTLHGQQVLEGSGRQAPSTYYTRSGPVGQVFAAIKADLTAQEHPRLAVIGLGAGTLACYAQHGQLWTFNEIDPAVVRVAEDSRFFTYLPDARNRGAHVDLVLGDARLKLREAPEHAHQLIIVDAFSSDAIPVHLLTREAVRLYMGKLAGSGVLAFNVTNRYVDLDPVIGLLASDAGLTCRVRHDVQLEAGELESGKQPSIWVVVARCEADLGDIATDPRWTPPRVRPGARVWTDDYSDLASYLILRARPFPARGR
jgi:spermidine synthase